MAISDDSTLREVRDWLRTQAQDGAKCPCCRQNVKIYKRSLSNAPARTMIALYRHDAHRDFVFLPPILDGMKGTPHQGGYCTLGHYWDLLEQAEGIREDGSSRVGWWKLTDLGARFVRGAATVPKYAHIYNGRRLRLDGPEVTIRQALGRKFNYDDLMHGR